MVKDLLFVAGVASVVGGVAMMHPPSSLVLAGVSMVGISWFGMPRGQ